MAASSSMNLTNSGSALTWAGTRNLLVRLPYMGWCPLQSACYTKHPPVIHLCVTCRATYAAVSAETTTGKAMPRRPQVRFTEETQLTLPLEYLTSSSENGLRNFETLQLSHAANIEKEIESMKREMDKARVMAELARLMIDHRTELLRRLGDHLERVRVEKTEAA